MNSKDMIRCPLYEAARQHPERPAIFWGVRRVTYAQLNQYVNAVVKSLRERGVRQGSRVVLLSENTIECVIALLGLWRMGAVACPINPKFPEQNIRTLLSALSPQCVVGAKSLKLSGVKAVDINDLIAYDAKNTFFSNIASDTMSFAPDQEAAIIFTSGSSGTPKAAVLSFGNLYFNALGSNEVVLLDPEDRWLLSLPLFHVSGLGIIMRCLVAQAAIVIAPQEEAIRLIEQGKVTHVSLVSTQLHRLLNHGPFSKPDSLKAVLLGGSAIGHHLLQKSLELGLPIFVSYGLTEMGSQVATGRLTSVSEGCARPLPYRELEIIDGEICVRGKTLFKGYWQSDNISLPVDREGWFHTGDLGELDRHGCLKVLGRKDDMFISGGENIHPQEIEGELMKIESVVQVMVVPKEDHEFGQRPIALIRWQEGKSSLTKEVLKEALVGKLPKFKIPVVFYVWPEHLEQGIKVSRREMKNILSAGKLVEIN